MGSTVSSPTARRRALLAEVLDEAANGAVAHWADLLDYQWWSPELAGGGGQPGPGNTHNARVTLKPKSDSDRDRMLRRDPQGRVTLDLPLLNGAVQRLGPANAAAKRRLARVEAGQDSTVGPSAADVLVQLAVFGKVVH